eukprot:4615614-Pyramimonas_sp.AAC.1
MTRARVVRRSDRGQVLHGCVEHRGRPLHLGLRIARWKLASHARERVGAWCTHRLQMIGFVCPCSASPVSGSTGRSWERR